MEVPETVVYNDTTWTVTSVGTAFSNCRGLTYVSLPATVTSLEQQAFLDCVRLDTLVFASATPMGIPRIVIWAAVYSIFSNSVSYNNRMAIIVPCGSLAAYRRTQWANFRGLRSECAVPLTVLASEEGLVRVDSIKVEHYTLHNSNGWYEVGDTAVVKAERLSLDIPGMIVPVCSRYGYFIGWSDGESDMSRPFVVEHADTLICYVDTFHYATLAVNRISTPVYQFGTLSYNGDDAQQHFVDIINGSGNHPSTLYGSGLWVGSSDSLSYSRELWELQMDDSTVSARTAVAKFNSYGTDFYPGPLRMGSATTDVSAMLEYSRVWHLTREQIDYHIAHCGEQGYVAIDDILTWPGNGDAADGYAAQLAPYYDADSNGRYNPYAGDYPVIRGDECVFSIFNDAGVHGESGSKPLGIEVHAMTYAFNEPADTALWNTVFIHYDVYNRGASHLPNTFFGAWSDFDIGYANDDFVGCDVERDMYYGYNGSEREAVSPNSFEGVVPAQGCLVLGGAMEEGERKGMTSFMYYENNLSAACGNPVKATDYYNYLHAYWMIHRHVKYGGNGLNIGTEDIDANYMFPGDSDPNHIGTGGVVPSSVWTEVTAGNQPSDRRGVAGSGPFEFVAGSCQQFDIAYTTGFGEVDVASSVSALQRNTDGVRRQWERDTTDSGKPFTYRPYSAPHEVGIAEAAQAEVMLYPNPTTGMLHVRLGLPERQQVQLLDMMGRVVMTATVEGGRATLDLTSLPQGVYILRTGGTAKRIVKK